MLNVSQVREIIIQPSIRAIDMWSQEDEELLLMVAAWESKLGTYLKQETGPALGPWMMEPSTHEDLWNRYLPHNVHTTAQLMSFLRLSQKPDAQMLSYNLRYACMMARVMIKRIPEPTPKRPEDMADFAKKYWNTEKGKATPADYLNAYNQATGVTNGKAQRKA